MAEDESVREEKECGEKKRVQEKGLSNSQTKAPGRRAGASPSNGECRKMGKYTEGERKSRSTEGEEERAGGAESWGTGEVSSPREKGGEKMNSCHRSLEMKLS